MTTVFICYILFIVKERFYKYAYYTESFIHGTDLTTIHGKGTFVTASDKQLAVEARKRAVEEEFDKAIDKAVSVGMNQNEILELVQLLLDEK